jgi:bacillolysin
VSSARRHAAVSLVLALLVTLGWVVAAHPADAATLTRAVCDGRNQKQSGHFCGPNVPVARAEGGAATGVKDVDAAYDLLGELAEFYSSLGGDLQQMVASDVNGVQAVNVSVRMCDVAQGCRGNETSPTYYTKKRVVIAVGMFADDTLGHEFTHGVQDHFGRLGQESEAFAITEAIADIMGELFDLTNGSSDDTPAVRWKMGDGSPYGVYRDMDKPTSRQMPDRKGGQYWSSDGNPVVNSAVIEKAGYLITDGKKFNGQDITGIGTAKSAALWYAVLKAMPAGADFKQLAATLRTVCAANTTAGVAGTTAADCDQVDKSIKATQLEI